MTLLDFSTNKKTYGVVAVGLVLGIVQGLDNSGVIHFQIPSYVNWLVGFAGLGTMRAAIQKQSGQTAVQVVALIQDVLQDLQAPPLHPVDVIAQVVKTDTYKQATPEEKTALLNASQLRN